MNQCQYIMDCCERCSKKASKRNGDKKEYCYQHQKAECGRRSHSEKTNIEGIFVPKKVILKKVIPDKVSKINIDDEIKSDIANIIGQNKKGNTKTSETFDNDKKIPQAILKLEFDLEDVDCVTYRCVSQKYWETILSVLKTQSKINVQPYSSPSPMELYGMKLTSKELIKKIVVISDPEKVSAFKIFHGEFFCNDTDPFDDLFEKCDKFLNKK